MVALTAALFRDDVPARRVAWTSRDSGAAGSGVCTPRGGPTPASPARTGACRSPVAWPGGLPCPWTRGTVDTVACCKAARGKRLSQRTRPDWIRTAERARLGHGASLLDCLAGRSVLPVDPGDGGHRGMPRDHQGQATEPTNSAMDQLSSGARLGCRVGCRRACGWGRACPEPSGQIPPPWAWWENEAPTTRAARRPFQASCGEPYSALSGPTTTGPWMSPRRRSGSAGSRPRAGTPWTRGRLGPPRWWRWRARP